MDCGGHRSHQRWRSGRALGCDPRRGHTRAIKEWSANVRPHVRDLCECPIKNRYVAVSWRRLNPTRADIVAGAVFPDYELTDHAGKRRKLSDLQGPDPMILVLSRGGYCPKDLRQAEGLVQLPKRWKAVTAAWSQSAPTTWRFVQVQFISHQGRTCDPTAP